MIGVALPSIRRDLHMSTGSLQWVVSAYVLTGAMLLLLFPLVEAPSAGWISLRTLGSFLAAGVLLGGFVAWERRARTPLVRLGILRSSSLVRANLGAMALFGSWVGFQF